MLEPIILKSEKEWLDMRSTVITATETSSLFSLNPYQSAAKMWQRKLVPDFQENAYTFLGKVLEPAVIKAVSLLTERHFEGFESKDSIPFFKHTEHCLGATPDAFHEEVLLECKTTSPGKFFEWRDRPPFYYIVQTHVQMLCTGTKKCLLACIPTHLTPEKFNSKFPIIIYLVEADPKLHKLILDTVDRFWDNIKVEENFKVNRDDCRKVKQWLVDSTTLLEI